MDDSVKRGKTRLSVQDRSDGDGMENSQSLIESKIGNIISLEPSQIKNFPQNFVPTPAKRKEPKFVPYEPYKAAVSPILNSNQRNSKYYVVSEKAKSLATDIIKQNSALKDISLSKTRDDLDAKLNCRNHNDVNDLDAKLNCRNHNNLNDCGDKIFQLEEKLGKLEKEKNDLEAQFSIQTQVNADLKKMLVAALGEDMQMKVQYMTEDKAKLGKDVLFYVEQLTEKNEEIEKLSVDCDVWKTKFEASSLLVKELASYKSASTEKIHEINSILLGLFREHEEIYKQQQISYNVLHHIQNAFNPNSKSSKTHCANNLIQISKEIRCLSNNIQSRLLGNSFLNLKSIAESKRQFTSAEQIAYEMLSRPGTSHSCMKPNSAETPRLGPGPTACSVMPHVCSMDATINCCTHCSGEILLI